MDKGTGKSNLYLALAVLGAILPALLLGIFIADEGFGDLGDAVFGNLAATAVFADLSISSLVFWVWMWPQAQRAGKSPWLFVLVNLLVGLSCALPLFLYYRERSGTSTA